MGVSYHDIGRQKATFSKNFAKTHEKLFFFLRRKKKTKRRDETENKSLKFGYAMRVDRALAARSPHLRRTFPV